MSVFSVGNGELLKVVLNKGQFCPLEDICQCLEIIFFVN